MRLDTKPPYSRPLWSTGGKTRRNTNVICCAHVKCNCQPADKGPLARAATTHIEHCVRSIYSPGKVWSRVTTSVWWPCGNPGV